MSPEILETAESYQDLIARFETCRIEKEEWTHAAHLAVGAWFVSQYPAIEAGVRLRTGIRKLNESMGGKNTETSGFHETLTELWILIARDWFATRAFSLEAVREFVLAYAGRSGCWRECYDFDVVNSRYARRAWVAPRTLPKAATPKAV